MSTIMFTTTIENGQLQLATDYFSEGDKVVIIPTPEYKLRIYPLAVWQEVQQKLEARPSLFKPDPIKKLLKEITTHEVKNQSIFLDETLVNFVNAEHRLWYAEHAQFIEVHPIKAVEKRMYALEKIEIDYYKRSIESLLNILKEELQCWRAITVDGLNEDTLNADLQRGITQIALGACKDFKIPKSGRHDIVHRVIAQIKFRAHQAPEQKNLKTWVYSIARTICIDYLRKAI